MNDQNKNQSPTSTWNVGDPIERFDARFHVVSSIASVPQSLGPENVKEAYHLSNEKMETMEKPDVTEYYSDGEVLLWDDRVMIRYPEPDSTGLGKCETSVSYWIDRPSLLELNRTGTSAVHCFFDTGDPVQHVVFQTPFGSFEPIITLKSLINLMSCGVGRLALSYTVDFPNIFTEHIDLVIDSRRLSPSETLSKSEAPRVDEESLRRMSRDLQNGNLFTPEKNSEEGQT